MAVLGFGSGGGEAFGLEEQTRHFANSGDRRHRRRITGGGSVGVNGGVSPDSLVYYSSDNNSGSRTGIVVSAGGSLLSSSAATTLAGDRCSFGSDGDVLVSPLAGSECSGCAPGPDQNSALQGSSSSPFLFHNQCHSNPPPNPSKGLLEDSTQRGDRKVVEEEEEEKALEATKYSFSKALKECQNKKNKSEALGLLSRKPWRPRPASVDFVSQGADASILSPRFLVGGVAGMTKDSVTSSRSKSGTFPSPGTPSYRHGAGAAAYQKGWSSERVPLPRNGNRRYAGSSVFLPFSNGRTLPWKWEDAEKWILSPASGGDGIERSSDPPSHHRRPKSKSGPLGNQGIGGTYAAVSPLVPCLDSGKAPVNFTANSPFLAGVLMPESGYCVKRGGGAGRVRGSNGGGAWHLYPTNEEPYIERSASIHGWSDTRVESSSSLPSSRDEKSESTRVTASVISPSVVRKDAATQMSSEGSSPSPPKDRSSFSHSPRTTQPIGQLECQFSKLEVRDVEVDDRVTVTRWSKKHNVRGSDGRSSNVIEWKKKTVEEESTTWEVAESKSISKYKREEAKITAWENLQKAKAEAEIRKLEVKLEKKRSSSMDKILNKLRSAQKKAEEMRSVVDAKQDDQVAKNARISYFRKTEMILEEAQKFLKFKLPSAEDDTC